MKNTFKVLSSILLLAVIIYACNKEDIPDIDPDNDVTTAEETGKAEERVTSVFAILDQTIHAQEYLYLKTSGDTCFTVEVSTTGSGATEHIDTLVIDFGTIGCEGFDGKIRKGKLTALLNGKYDVQGTVVNVTIDNYFVNDYKVEGTMTITNNGVSGSNKNFTITLANGIITTPENDAISWNTTRTYDQQAGGSTNLDPLDDVYHITGSSDGINSKGVAFTVEITDALVLDFACKWITQGVFKVTPSGMNPRIVDFGEGTCDANVTVTIGKLSIPITI